MIPAIIYLLLRRYRRSNPEKAERLAMVLRNAGRMVLFFILLLLISLFALPQPTKPESQILHLYN